MTTTTPIKFDIAINKKWQGEKLPLDDPRWGEYTASFHKEHHSIESLIHRVSVDGCSFTAVMNGGYRKKENFISAQHIGLDDDRGTTESSIEALAEDPFIADHAAFLYPSPSSTPQVPKSRVVFILDTPFTDPDTYRVAAEAMCWKYQGTDPYVSDPARLFYGRPNTQHINLGNVLYRDILQEQVIEPYLESLKNAGNGHKPAEPISKTVPEGSRNHTMASIVGSMWQRGMSKEAITAAAHVQNEQTFDPPLPPAEVDSVVASISRKPPGALPVTQPSTSSDPPRNGHQPSEPAGAWLIGPTSEKPEELPRPKSFAQLLQMEIKEQPMVVSGLISQGSLNLVAGRPDQGKSLAVQDLLTAHACGGLWLGQFPAGQGVSGFFDFEMPEDRFALRLKAQASHRGVTDIPMFRFEGLTHMLDKDEGADELYGLIREFDLSLVALDPVSDILGGSNENDATPVRQAFARLIQITRLVPVTFILPDHRRKAGLVRSSPLDEIRGSTVKVAKSDSILSITKANDLVKVEHLRFKWGPKHSAFSFKFQEADPDIVPVYSGEIEDGGAEMLERCIPAVLDALGEGPLKRQALIATVGETTKAGDRTVITAISKLVEDEEILKGKDGREVVFRLPEEATD
ncbi:MAG: AAA family ATPase [Verrucomicrobia bacterium]|nr:AAA family ATPase [Verrucomicrobiota bacterium]